MNILKTVDSGFSGGLPANKNTYTLFLNISDFEAVSNPTPNVIKLRGKSQKDVTLSVVEGHLFAIYQSQEVFDYAQTDDRGA
ncbi:hypothetical protein EZ456_23875 [Pedobacter psychrodurus]|uniref:Uncharacterized protein n=1 Tax=Pedobacter psychrodurus TaxID=2530456 RepID=A0A4R0PIK1_9SPHI|nr:hypothetical protein [Pedobacter psychrodurus]TCD16854.1 hypothetical protein EZ456_23875 [Pedobacter psychrodurus]